MLITLFPFKTAAKSVFPSHLALASSQSKWKVRGAVVGGGIKERM